MNEILPDGSASESQCPYMWASQSAVTNVTKRCTFTARNNAVYVVRFAGAVNVDNVTITNYQMEEGSTATPYEPYGNLYIPQNQ